MKSLWGSFWSGVNRLTAPPSPLTLRANVFSSSNPPKPNSFSVTSYNILAQEYITDKHYPHCQTKFKHEKHREVQVLKEIEYLNSDIYALQEVSESAFFSLYSRLKEKGYRGHYAQKPFRPEGLATFYNESKFNLKDLKLFDFDKKLIEMCKKKRIDPGRYGVLQRNVALFLLLEAKNENGNGLNEHQSKPSFICGNVHIHWDWRRKDFQALQIALTLQSLFEFSKSKKIPYVMCGDFNVQPNSLPYTLLTKGKLNDEEWSEFRILQSQQQGKRKNQNLLSIFEEDIGHPCTNINSAYFKGLGREPDFTNYTPLFKGCLDYIMYSENLLELEQILNIVPETELVKLKACPNKYFPSDHLSLKANFSFPTLLNC